MSAWKCFGLSAVLPLILLTCAPAPRAVAARRPAASQLARAPEYEAITSLYVRAFRAHSKDREESRRMFEEAARRLKDWIGRYEKDSRSLSFLLQQARLGLYMEAAGKSKDAARAYQTCLRHRLFASRDAVLPICDGGERNDCRYEKVSVREIVAEGLERLTAKGDVPGRLRAGGSKTIRHEGSSKCQHCDEDDWLLPPRVGEGGEPLL